MSAAYYDIQAEQGATYRLYLTVADKDGKALNLKGELRDDVRFTPVDELPIGFESRFITESSDNDVLSIATAYVRMQVRNTVDGVVLPIAPPADVTSITNDLALFGVSGYGLDFFPIDIQLGDGGATNTDPNIIITIDAIHMEGVEAGKPLYDIELVYAQDTISHPKKVVYRIMQGRFIITPGVTK
jgi:hypothetical protein